LIHLIAAAPKSYLITATATDPNGKASQFSTTRFATATDTDGDGMPDNYEAAHPGATDPNADNDGDGLTIFRKCLREQIRSRRLFVFRLPRQQEVETTSRSPSDLSSAKPIAWIIATISLLETG
jgi:hypothetical protein